MPIKVTDHLVTVNGRLSLEHFFSPLLRLANVQADFLGSFEIAGENYALPRFGFVGPNSADPIRIALFGAIHGDEPAGALALVQFLLDLSAQPELAENFLLHVY